MLQALSELWVTYYIRFINLNGFSSMQHKDANMLKYQYSPILMGMYGNFIS